MRTKITELLKIKYPIVMAGMGFVGNVKLAAEVSNAGGMGMLSSFNMTPEELHKNIKMMRELTDKPFGVNVLNGDPREHELGDVVASERVPLVSYGKGDPAWLMKAVKEYGCLKMPSVGAVRHAIKAEQNGADLLVVQGMEGGGHTGYVSSLVLMPLVASKVKVPLLAAGGYCDGRGLVAALALGADGIYMGTRFAITRESPMHQISKERYLTATEEDLVITTKMTGWRASAIRNKFTDLLEKEEKGLHIKDIISEALEMSRTWHIPLWKLMLHGIRYKSLANVTFSGLGTLATGVPRYYSAVMKGDPEWGWLPAGQVVGRINDIPTCKELIERTIDEAENILAQMGPMFAEPRSAATS